jgi:hypothetical protein
VSAVGKSISGIALAAGRSLNGRLYRPDLIQRMTERAQAAIRAGRVLMYSSHGAADADDSLRVVGALRELTCDEEGVARYRAELVDTTAGRDAAALIAGPRSHLAVSIRGRWIGQMQREQTPEGPAEYGEDLELLGLDLTGSPGVPQATASAAERQRRDPRLVVESATIGELAPRPLHEMDGDEFRAYAAEQLDLAHRAVGAREALLQESRAARADWWKA